VDEEEVTHGLVEEEVTVCLVGDMTKRGDEDREQSN